MPCLIRWALESLAFECGDFSVHVREDGGDGGLFGQSSAEVFRRPSMSHFETDSLLSCRIRRLRALNLPSEARSQVLAERIV